MVELIESIAFAYGWGFVYLFTIPAVIICGIVLFGICESALSEWRERRERRRRGEDDIASWQDIHLEAPALHVERPEMGLEKLRKWHYRPPDPLLTQPFTKQPNRPITDAYRWG